MEIPLNTQDYNCYNWPVSTVAPQNFIRFLHQKAEVLKLLVIMHLRGFSLSFLSVFYSGQLILASSVYVHYMFSICLLYVHYMFSICSPDVHCMFTICSPYVQYMFTTCSIYVHYVFTICSIYVHYMFNICSLYVHYMYSSSQLILASSVYPILNNKLWRKTFLYFLDLRTCFSNQEIKPQ